jgi:hypothetical protein
MQKMNARESHDIALDTTYSSRHWHANEITTLARDAQVGMLPTIHPDFPSLTPQVGNREGGIIARVHLLKDTASGAAQHELRQYQGTSRTAEGDATEQLLLQLKVSATFCHPLTNRSFHGQDAGVEYLSSAIADGDTAIQHHVQQHFGRAVPIYRDPNHYAKGLLKNVEHLCNDFPVLDGLGKLLKTHFLVGRYPGFVRLFC